MPREDTPSMMAIGRLSVSVEDQRLNLPREAMCKATPHAAERSFALPAEAIRPGNELRPPIWRGAVSEGRASTLHPD